MKHLKQGLWTKANNTIPLVWHGEPCLRHSHQSASHQILSEVGQDEVQLLSSSLYLPPGAQDGKMDLLTYFGLKDEINKD